MTRIVYVILTCLSAYGMSIIFMFQLILFIGQAFSLSSAPKPIIGIAQEWDASNVILTSNYADSVFRVGGIPYVLPRTLNQDDIDYMVQNVDGVIVPGGPDINPLFYDEDPVNELGPIYQDHDKFTYYVLKSMMKYNKTYLGICRGLQFLNIYEGGTLYQDIPTQFNNSIKHYQHGTNGNVPTHKITINEGSILKKLLNRTHAVVNSFHHQSVKKLAEGYMVTAQAADGTIEGIEKIGNPKILAVQFHPEEFCVDQEDVYLPIFKYLIEQAQLDAIKRLKK